MAPTRENPSNLALLGALRLQRGSEAEGTCSESHFERRSLQRYLTDTALCLRAGLPRRFSVDPDAVCDEAAGQMFENCDLEVRGQLGERRSSGGRLNASPGAEERRSGYTCHNDTLL